MSPRLPRPAAEALDRASLCHVAVQSRHGLHLTPMVFVLDGGRLWVTTSRNSVKARAWRRDPFLAGVVEHEDTAVLFRGPVRVYDALDPLTWPAAAVGGPLIARAAVRFSFKNARFFAGYAADARRVPLAWTPPGRIFARIDPVAGHVLHTDGPDRGQGATPVAQWGEWTAGEAFRRSFAPSLRERALDLRVPRSVREAVGQSGRGALGLAGSDGPVVVPAAWRRAEAGSSYEAVVPRVVLALASAPATASAALTVSHLARWRAADMRGMLLQGQAEMYAIGETTRGVGELRRRLAALGAEGDSSEVALVRIRPQRIVWWEGWTSGTVARRRGDAPAR